MLLLILPQDPRLPKCFSFDPQHKTGFSLISLGPVKAQPGPIIVLDTEIHPIFFIFILLFL